MFLCGTMAFYVHDVGIGFPAKPFFNKPLLLAAHRGGSALWPENTVEAYKSALSNGRTFSWKATRN